MEKVTGRMKVIFVLFGKKERCEVRWKTDDERVNIQ